MHSRAFVSLTATTLVVGFGKLQSRPGPCAQATVADNGGAASPVAADCGYITGPDGVRLYYEIVGSGSQTVILPGRLFLIHTLSRLAPARRLIFYDTRARGRSDAVHNAARETIMDDVRDLEALRSQLAPSGRVSLVGYSYMGLLVMLYAKAHLDPSSA